MYHKPRMCRTCLQMSRGDFKFVNLDSVDPLWDSNSPNLKEQLIYIVPEMKLETTEAFICTSCFIALRTAYEFKRMCQITEQKFQNYNYKYRRPFGVGPGSPQFHVTLNENNNSSVPTYRCQSLNYLQTDTSIDITEHHLYDASKVLPRKQLAYLNNVSQKLPEIDVEVIMGQNADKSDKAQAITDDSKENKNEKLPENKIDSKADNKVEIKAEKKVEVKTEKKPESKPVSKVDSRPQPKIDNKPQTRIENKPQTRTENKPQTRLENKPQSRVENKPQSKIESKQPVKVENKPESKVDNKPLNKVESKPEITVEAKSEKADPNPVQEEKESAASVPTDSKLKFLPNLPGIEIVPKKLDSLELRKIYNIGSQISILKTPKQLSAIDIIVKKACDEIPYLKTNNILPDALNCSIRIEKLTSELTAGVTTEKYTVKELDELAKSYYGECGDLLNCKFCDRNFSTEYWLKIHEEDHSKPKPVEKPIIPEEIKDTVSTVTPTVDLVPKPKDIEEPSKSPTPVQPISEEVTSNPSKISLPPKPNDIEEPSKFAIPALPVFKEVSLPPKPKDIEEPSKSAAPVQPVSKEITSNPSKISLPPQLQSDQISLTPIQKNPIQNITKPEEKAVEPKPEPEISISNHTIPIPLPDIICKSSEISLVKADNASPSQVASKEEDSVTTEKIVPQVEDAVKSEPMEEAEQPLLPPEEEPVVSPQSPVLQPEKPPLPLPLLPIEESPLLSPDISPPSSPEISPPLSPEISSPLSPEISPPLSPEISPPLSPEKPTATEILEPKEKIVTEIKSEPKQERRFKIRRFKSLGKKNKLIGVRYLKCFVCFKHFKSKLCLYQHCRFTHIPNESNSSYWFNFISYKKQQTPKKEVEDVKIEEEVEEDDEVDAGDADGEVETDMEVEVDVKVETGKEEVMPIRAAKAKRNAIVQYNCNICDKTVKEEAHLAIHMYVHVVPFASMDPELREQETAEIFRCYLCEKAFPKERYLKLHNLQVHLTKPCICKICNREFKSEFWFSRHKCVIPSEIPEPEEEVIDEEGREFSCTLCDRKFARLRFMKSHRKRMHKDILENSNTGDDSVKAPLRNDSDDSEHSGYESNQEYDLPNDNEKEPEASTVNSLPEVSSKRRSLSRGIPKIQCDFCGEYIEETAYDKHIFEHNKVRLNKSLSKRKSLETSSVDEISEKKESLLKCHVCYKSFKRKHNLAIHIAKHQGISADPTSILSEADETLEDDTETYLSENEAQSMKEHVPSSEDIPVQVSLVEGSEMYTCCNRLFRWKAHFCRHYKKQHKKYFPIFSYIGGPFDNALERKLTEDAYLENRVKHFSDRKTEYNLEKSETTLDVSAIDSEALDESKIEQNDSTVSATDKENVKAEPIPTEEIPKKRRKYTRKIYTVDGNAKKTRKLHKQKIATENEETDLNNSQEETLASENVKKRKLSTDDDPEEGHKPRKVPKLTKKEKGEIKSEGGEDLAASAEHLRQLDLLPVNKGQGPGFECQICEKKFRQKCQLRDHFNVHTGDKPYKCDFCKPARGFTQTSSLYVHFRRVHAVVTKNCSWEVYSKNGDCLICSDVFFRHSQMFDHMKAYYVEKEFECHVCNKKFNMSCHFKTHEIAPEDMQHLFIKDDVNEEEGEEDEEEPLPENEPEEKLQSDTDTADRISGNEDNESKESHIRCSKCDKSFDDKQQLRFHKKSLAHFQQIQAKRRKSKAIREEQPEEEEEGEVDSSVNNTAETIEDIENGVKAIIKKIRIFKKHHCNICGMSFIRRMQLKKHKRTSHKSRKSKNNTSIDEETTTLELHDASELNQFIHDNLSDEAEDEEKPNELQLEQSTLEELVDSTVGSEEQHVTSTSSENLNLDKTDMEIEENVSGDLDQIEESTLNKDEENIIQENSSDGFETKILDVMVEATEEIIETTEEVCDSPKTDELPEDNLQSNVIESYTSDNLSDGERHDEFPNIEGIDVMDCIVGNANITKLSISEDIGQSAVSIINNACLESIELPTDHISTNETAPISKECDVQNKSNPNVFETNETSFNDLALDEQQSLVSDPNTCLALDE